MSSQVCRFYLNGNCRFGDRCRYSHNVPDSHYGSGYSSPNPYVLNRNPPHDRQNYNEPKQNWKQNMSYNDVQELIEKIRDEAKQVEYENLWPLTCLSVMREGANVPGWEDFSMEELRTAAYSAKLTNRFDEYVRFYQNLIQKAKESRSIFLRPGKRAEETVRAMWENRGKDDGKPSSSFSFSQVPAFSGFSSTASSGTGTLGAGSIFGGSQAPTAGSAFGSTPFGSGSGDPAPGIFAMAAQGFASNVSQGSGLNDTEMETASESLFNQSSTSVVSPPHQNIFGQVAQQSGFSAVGTSSAFGGAPTTTASIFGGNTAPPSVFGGSTAKTVDVNTASPNVFGGAPTSSPFSSSQGCESRGMELHGQWDDEEQQLVIVEGNERASSSLTVTNPFGPEMVAVTSEMAGAEAPAQGSTTPKPVIAPEPTAQTPEMVSIPEPPPDGDQYQRTDIPERFSFEAIRESVNSMLAASDGNLVPPDVSSIQNVLGNFMGSTHFLSAPDVNNSLTQANSMLTPIFANVSDVERNKMMTELIINCIHKQKVLWDSTDPEFGNSKMCPLLWNNIASVCGMDVKKLRNKWNSLKKTFRKEYIKCITTGLTSKSPNFHAMSFLEGEIKRELQRESKEKVLVMQQLKKINGGNEPLDASGSSILHNLEAEEDDEYTSDPNDDDCMIVETVERLSVPSTSQARAVDTSTLPSQATSSKSDAGIQGLSQNAVSAPPTIRAKNILELQNKRPLGSESAQGSESSTSKNRSSPEVICLGDSKESQKPVKQYVAVPGKPIIKFSPSANSTVRSTIVVEAGMPKSLNEANLSVKVEEDSNLKPEPPAVIKQCARKSTSRANVKLFPWQNGARNAIAAPELNPVNTDKIPHPQGSSVMATESVKNDNEIQWKIQDARSIETGQTSMKQHVEPTRIGSIILSKQDCNRTSTITVLPKPRPVEAGQTSAKQQHIEPTRIRSSGNTPTAILPKPRSKEASQKYTKQNMEPTRSKSCSLSKPDSNTDSNETPTIAILPKPEPVDDDEIQIIKEVPGTSPHKGTTNQPITETRKRGTAEDPPAPPKRPRTSNGAECPPQRVAVKRKVDKDRENSANEHFLLSMLYDVETMSSEQFRRLKKHSTALASMILDPQ